MDILPQLLANGVIAGAVYALMAIAFSLSFSTGKFFNLALGAMVPVGGYAVYALSVQNNFPLFFSVPTGLFIAGIISMFCELWVFRPPPGQARIEPCAHYRVVRIATAQVRFLRCSFKSATAFASRTGSVTLDRGNFGYEFAALHDRALAGDERGDDRHHPSDRIRARGACGQRRQRGRLSGWH